MNGYEEQLVTRAEMLQDTDELAQAVTDVLAGAQGAGLDPGAVTSLTAAARALGPAGSTGYDAGSKTGRHPGSGYGSDSEFLEAVSGAEGEIRQRLREVAAAPGKDRHGAGRRAGGAQGRPRDARQR